MHHCIHRLRRTSLEVTAASQLHKCHAYCTHSDADTAIFQLRRLDSSQGGSCGDFLCFLFFVFILFWGWVFFCRLAACSESTEAGRQHNTVQKFPLGDQISYKCKGQVAVVLNQQPPWSIEPFPCGDCMVTLLTDFFSSKVPQATVWLLWTLGQAMGPAAVLQRPEGKRGSMVAMLKINKNGPCTRVIPSWHGCPTNEWPEASSYNSRVVS